MRLAFAEIAERGHRADEVIQLTDEVLERVESVASEYRIARLHLLRSRARRQMANFDAAQWELEQGIKHLESKRALLQQDSQRIWSLDTAWDLTRTWWAFSRSIAVTRTRRSIGPTAAARAPCRICWPLSIRKDYAERRKLLANTTRFCF